jgi:hypothetical protein
MDKLLSGRFIFTVITALIFAQMAMSGRVSSEQAMATITLVIAFYFNKNMNGGTK